MSNTTAATATVITVVTMILRTIGLSHSIRENRCFCSLVDCSYALSRCTGGRSGCSVASGGAARERIREQR